MTTILFTLDEMVRMYVNTISSSSMIAFGLYFHDFSETGIKGFVDVPVDYSD